MIKEQIKSVDFHILEAGNRFFNFFALLITWSINWLPKQ